MTTHSTMPKRLYLMQIATLHQMEAPWPIPCPCYLIEMSDGKKILIDTGFPENPPPRPGLQLAENVIEQLERLEIRPEDIDMLICTHFDLDHVGYHSSFTKATLVVQREHYELARSGYPRFAMSRPIWDHPDLHYRLIDGDIELLPGIKLIVTHNHTRAQQSVLVRLPQTGPVLLTIDSVMTQSDFNRDRKPHPLDDDPSGELGRASASKLIDIAEREQAGMVIFGHDGQQWPTLKKLPEYYQ